MELPKQQVARNKGKAWPCDSLEEEAMFEHLVQKKIGKPPCQEKNAQTKEKTSQEIQAKGIPLTHRTHSVRGYDTKCIAFLESAGMAKVGKISLLTDWHPAMGETKKEMRVNKKKMFLDPTLAPIFAEKTIIRNRLGWRSNRNTTQLLPPVVSLIVDKKYGWHPKLKEPRVGLGYQC